MANEKRLIDANALITNLRTFKGLGSMVAETLVRFTEKQPTVDAVEVVHGRWIMGVDIADYEYGVCSVCGYEERDAFPCNRTPKYCPECGAKMDGDGTG